MTPEVPPLVLPPKVSSTIEGWLPPPPPPDTAKISLVQHILHDHTLFGLCFAKDRPPAIAAGRCSVSAKALSVRHRLFVFVFALVGTMTASVYVSIGMRSAAWGFFFGALAVLPCTCYIRANIVSISFGFGKYLPVWRVRAVLFFRFEEWILAGWIAWIVVAFARYPEPDPEDGGPTPLEALWWSLGSFGLQLCLEVVSLTWFYFFRRACCPCCVPTRANADLHNPFEEKPSKEKEAEPRAIEVVIEAEAENSQQLKV